MVLPKWGKNNECVCFKVKHKRVHIAQDQAQTETTLNIAQWHHKEKLQIQTPGKNKEEEKRGTCWDSLPWSLPTNDSADDVSWRQNEPSHFAEFGRGVIRDFWTRKHRGTTLTWPDYNLVFEQEYWDLFSEGGSQKCEFSYDTLIFFSSFFLLAVEEMRFLVLHLFSNCRSYCSYSS